MTASLDVPALTKKTLTLPFSQAWRERVGASIDPLGVVSPLMHAQLSWWLHPQELAEQAASFWTDWAQLCAHAARRGMGLPSNDPVTPQPDDTRFVDPAWTEHATWDLYKESYLLITRHIQDMLYETPGLSPKEQRRAAFWWRNYLNALAPTNFFWTNPLAMRQAVETHGDSLRRGWKNFVEDMEAGDIRMTDPTDFKVGENLATTPGAVVFRNRLVEVIHYAPTQAKLHKIPIVIVTAWINKYYILDLTAKKSLVAYLRDQGFDVYITSWKNPDESMADVKFEDYLTDGIDPLVRIAKEISGSDQVHAVGYCLGGTALACYMAWSAKQHEGKETPSIPHWTLLTALTDFSCPGDIEVFIDPGSVAYMTENMKEKGVLEGKAMSWSFRLLRANSLIWNYYVGSYLYGEKPAPFDALYWNTDMTRMPAAMHSWYLRELYLHNRLIEPNALTLAGQPISLERINQPLYLVAAQDDHIAPWIETFRIANFVRGPKRHVLSSSGHIFGIVNPPVDPPKRKFAAETVHRTDTPSGWLAKAQWQSGSWWQDWVAWLKPQMGEMVSAPKVTSAKYPKLADAPGTYVLER